MEERMFKLLRELVEFESVSGNEGSLTVFLAERLKSQGFMVSLQEVTSGRHNLVARKGDPRIL